MTLTQPKPYFAVSKGLIKLLTHTLTTQKIDLSDAQTVIFNFRDPDYSPETGGFHPVEIGLTRDGDQWEFSYITDFAYVGYYNELGIELDFSFHLESAYQSGIGRFYGQPAKQLFRLWQANFVEYVKSDIFTVNVTFY